MTHKYYVVLSKFDQQTGKLTHTSLGGDDTLIGIQAMHDGALSALTKEGVKFHQLAVYRQEELATFPDPIADLD